MKYICCGFPMIYQEFFGIRRYMCDYRSHHPEIFVNLYTGEQIKDDNLVWQHQDEE